MTYFFMFIIGGLALALIVQTTRLGRAESGRLEAEAKAERLYGELVETQAQADAGTLDLPTLAAKLRNRLDNS